MIKIHIPLNSDTPIENYIKIFKKKVTYEGILEVYRRKRYFHSRRENKELKRVKKHIFIKNIQRLNNKISNISSKNIAKSSEAKKSNIAWTEDKKPVSSEIEKDNISEDNVKLKKW